MPNEIAPSTTQNALPICVFISQELNEKIMAAVAATGLKKSDVVRLSVDRGIEILVNQLS